MDSPSSPERPIVPYSLFIYRNELRILGLFGLLGLFNRNLYIIAIIQV